MSKSYPEVDPAVYAPPGECIAEAMGVECVDGLVQVGIPVSYQSAYNAVSGLAGCGNYDHQAETDKRET